MAVPAAGPAPSARPTICSCGCTAEHRAGAAQLRTAGAGAHPLPAGRPDRTGRVRGTGVEGFACVRAERNHMRSEGWTGVFPLAQEMPATTAADWAEIDAAFLDRTRTRCWARTAPRAKRTSATSFGASSISLAIGLGPYAWSVPGLHRGASVAFGEVLVPLRRAGRRSRATCAGAARAIPA